MENNNLTREEVIITRTSLSEFISVIVEILEEEESKKIINIKRINNLKKVFKTSLSAFQKLEIILNKLN